MILVFLVGILTCLTFMPNPVVSLTIKDEKSLDAKDASLPVRIEIESGDSLGRANGVYFKEGGILYLVTAGHVLADTATGLRTNARVLLKSKDSQGSDTAVLVFSLNLAELESSNNVRLWRDIDILAIRLMLNEMKYSPGVTLLRSTKSPITALGDEGIASCESASWPCKVQLWAFSSRPDSNSIRDLRMGLDIVTGELLGVRQNSPILLMTYRGQNGYSGGPIFVQCDKEDFFGALVIGIHTGTIEWDEPDDSSHTDLISYGTCAAEVLSRIQSSW